MSSNNQIKITKNFEIYNQDVEGCGGFLIGKGNSAKDALRIAQEYCQDNEVEYGIDSSEIVV